MPEARKYKVVVTNQPKIESDLNKAAKNGWRVVSAFSAFGKFFIILERRRS